MVFIPHTTGKLSSTYDTFVLPSGAYVGSQLGVLLGQSGGGYSKYLQDCTKDNPESLEHGVLLIIHSFLDDHKVDHVSDGHSYMYVEDLAADGWHKYVKLYNSYETELDVTEMGHVLKHVLPNVFPDMVSLTDLPEPPMFFEKYFDQMKAPSKTMGFPHMAVDWVAQEGDASVGKAEGGEESYASVKYFHETMASKKMVLQEPLAPVCIITAPLSMLIKTAFDELSGTYTYVWQGTITLEASPVSVDVKQAVKFVNGFGLASFLNEEEEVYAVQLCEGVFGLNVVKIINMKTGVCYGEDQKNS